MGLPGSCALKRLDEWTGEVTAPNGPEAHPSEEERAKKAEDIQKPRAEPFGRAGKVHRALKSTGLGDQNPVRVRKAYATPRIDTAASRPSRVFRLGR